MPDPIQNQNPMNPPAPPAAAGPVTPEVLPTFPTIEDTAGSSAPNADIVPSAVVPPKKKFGGKKLIATILGLLLLVGGIVTGVVLVQQQQEIREKAREGEQCTPGDIDSENCTTPLGCPGYRERTCSVDGTWGSWSICMDIADNCPTSTPPPYSCKPPNYCIPSGENCDAGDKKGGGSCPPNMVCCQKGGAPTPTPTPTPTPGGCADPKPWPPNGHACKRVSDPTYSRKIGGCIVYKCPNGCGGDGKCDENDSGVTTDFKSNCSSSEEGLNENSCWQIDTVDTSHVYCIPQGCYLDSKPNCPSGCGGPPGETAQCLNIKAYDTSWNPLSADQLKALKSGDKVRFAVAGSPAGKIDKAKFKINGVDRPETTNKKPGTDEYYDEYMIPAGVTSFTVNAKLHHKTLGWF